MATPTLKALRSSFPDARLVGVAKPVIRQVLESQPHAPAHVDEWVLYRKKWIRSDANATSRLGLIKRLRHSQLDALLLLTNSLWTASVSRAAGIRTIIGYQRDGRGPLLTDRLLPPKRDGRHIPISAVDYYLEIARWLGCEADDQQMFLEVDEASQQHSDKLWSDLGLQSDCPTVVINNNAAHQIARIWPESHVTDLIQGIRRNSSAQVLLHCGPGEEQAANRVADDFADPKVASMGHCQDLPIGLSKAVLARAAVVVSTDSGARHMAAALNRPVVSLFGPTSPVWTRTYNHPEQIFEHADLACRSCYRRECPLGHTRCMRDLSSEPVLDAVLAALSTQSNTHRLPSTRQTRFQLPQVRKTA